MFAITTKYHGATNTRGSRISATVQDGSGWKKRVYVAYDHSLPATGDAVFRKAAEAMCDKLTAMGMTWSNPDNLVSGTIPNGYVFVFRPDALGTPEPTAYEPLDYLLIRDDKVIAVSGNADFDDGDHPIVELKTDTVVQVISNGEDIPYLNTEQA